MLLLDAFIQLMNTPHFDFALQPINLAFTIIIIIIIILIFFLFSLYLMTHLEPAQRPLSP